MGLAKQLLNEEYTLSMGCRVSVTSGLGGTTVKWSVSRMSAGEGRRPRKGDETVGFTCPRCHKPLSVTVESLAKARAKYEIYRVLGWLLLLSLLVTVPMLVHLGGQTVEEGDTEPVNVIGRLVAACAVAIIIGPAFLTTAGNYSGVKKLRLVRDGGGRTVWVQGHRLF
ncbi:hypothetical protein ABT084_02985 [Streptomyces sp. NPDC002138]|uniref:hypothetical protein n=1 Tax=Streptomyces sp. NPDC002138 TaxID=3154410 RepID=UPI0033198E9D